MWVLYLLPPPSARLRLLACGVEPLPSRTSLRAEVMRQSAVSGWRRAAGHVTWWVSRGVSEQEDWRRTARSSGVGRQDRDRLWPGDILVYMRTDNHGLGTRGTQHAPNNGKSWRGQFNWDESNRLAQWWVAKSRKPQVSDPWFYIQNEVYMLIVISVEMPSCWGIN